MAIQQVLTLSSPISKYKLSCLALPNFFVATREFLSSNLVTVASLSGQISLLKRASLSRRICSCSKYALFNYFVATHEFVWPNFVVVACLSCQVILLQRAGLSPEFCCCLSCIAQFICCNARACFANFVVVAVVVATFLAKLVCCWDARVFNSFPNFVVLVCLTKFVCYSSVCVTLNRLAVVVAESYCLL